MPKQPKKSDPNLYDDWDPRESRKGSAFGMLKSLVRGGHSPFDDDEYSDEQKSESEEDPDSPMAPEPSSFSKLKNAIFPEQRDIFAEKSDDGSDAESAKSASPTSHAERRDPVTRPSSQSPGMFRPTTSARVENRHEHTFQQAWNTLHGTKEDKVRSCLLEYINGGGLFSNRTYTKEAVALYDKSRKEGMTAVQMLREMKKWPNINPDGHAQGMINVLEHEIQTSPAFRMKGR